MSRWKGLPASLDHRVRHLVVQLRRLKDHSGLSLAALAARTSYSKSSWERYLNGKKLPPRAAVEALARVCEADVPRLLALHEVAEQAWNAERPGPPAEKAATDETAEKNETAEKDETAEKAEKPATATAAPPASGRGMPFGPLVLGALAVLVAAGAVLLVARLWEDANGIGRGAGAAMTAGGTDAAPAFTHRPGEDFGCRVQRRAGALYAGHSRTDTAVLGSGASGWDVVEAQCLLRHQGYDPGGVDGIVGGRTVRAVKRLQARFKLPTDGIVGPDTWKVLRR
ncbi:helix-turn-helix domain-containing protein [Streptomyces decoyicus]|uniref:helix-turn-helix domain-containing protein n=1 Tax=Streptomyces decoyicus TaxID=249567 RepID=UPI00386364FF|nr:peptidoglycan-binding protein [Streptomyces decoyicus]